MVPVNESYVTRNSVTTDTFNFVKLTKFPQLLWVTLPRAGGTTMYKSTSSGWPMEEALCEGTLKGCAE